VLDRELVQIGRLLHGAAIVRTGLLLGADRLAVPRDGQLEEDLGAGLATFGDGLLGMRAARAERRLHVDQALDLGDLLGFRSRRDDGVRDSGLPVTQPIRLWSLRHQRVIDLNRLGPLTGVEVELRQTLEHLERLVFVRRVALEERERLIRSADAGVRHDELAARLTRHVLCVTRIGVRLRELEHLDELRQRAPEVFEVVEDPCLLVEREAVDRVLLGRVLENLGVELARRAHVALAEVVLGERQPRVRNEATVRVPLDEAHVDLTRAVELAHFLEAEGQREENLVHAPVVRIVLHQACIRADRALTRAGQLLLGLLLLALELAHLLGVAGLLRLEDLLVERTRARVPVGLELEVGLRESQEIVGAANVTGPKTTDDALRRLDFASQEIERALLTSGGAASALGSGQLDAWGRLLLLGRLRLLARMGREVARGSGRACTAIGRRCTRRTRLDDLTSSGFDALRRLGAASLRAHGERQCSREHGGHQQNRQLLTAHSHHHRPWREKPVGTASA
jgi:hypothetical protein